jgi:hypothetical protein
VVFARKAGLDHLHCFRQVAVLLVLLPLLHGEFGRGHGERRILPHHPAVVGDRFFQRGNRHHLADETHAQRFFRIELARRHEDVGGVGAPSTFMKRRTPAGL